MGYMKLSCLCLIICCANWAMAQNSVDQLIHQPFGASCDLETVSESLKGKVADRIPFENPHATNLTDIIIKFRKGKNELAIYHGAYNTFCYGLHIESKRWKLDAALQIRMKLEDFIKAYPNAQKMKEDHYRLWDSDRVDWADIYFNKRDRVKQIDLGFYVD